VWTRPACGRSGGDLTGANPVDRAKLGSKLHLAVEGTGLPLSLVVSAANANDSTMLEAVLDDIPAVRTPAGGRRCRPEKCHADKGYDYRHCRRYLTRRGIKVRIARRGIDSSERLGRHRWKAERTIAWLDGCRRLRVRYDRGSERFFAFVMLGCARLCYNRRVSADTDYSPARSPPASQFRNVLLALGDPQQRAGVGDRHPDRTRGGRDIDRMAADRDRLDRPVGPRVDADHDHVLGRRVGAVVAGHPDAPGADHQVAGMVGPDWDRRPDHPVRR
jgi:transposase